MIYTKTVQNKSKIVNITGAAQTLEDLLGTFPDPSVANTVKIYFIGAMIGANAVAWYTEDAGVTLASGNGRPLYSGGIITVTKVNFTLFRILKNSGPDFDMFCVQFDFEQPST